MRGVTRRRNSNAFAAAGGVCALLVGLAAIDERIRHQLASALARREATDDFASIGSRLGEVGVLVLQVAQEQTIEHAPMVIFALAAAVLLLFMTRT